MRANGWQYSWTSEGRGLAHFPPLSTGAKGSAGGQGLAWPPLGRAEWAADLNNLRRFGRFTRDLFSRTAPASARKPLIFLDSLSAALPATSDNVQTVNFGQIGLTVALRLFTGTQGDSSDDLMKRSPPQL